MYLRHTSSIYADGAKPFLFGWVGSTFDSLTSRLNVLGESIGDVFGARAGEHGIGAGTLVCTHEERERMFRHSYTKTRDQSSH